jgi:hypothetical protein
MNLPKEPISRLCWTLIGLRFGSKFVSTKHFATPKVGYMSGARLQGSRFNTMLNFYMKLKPRIIVVALGLALMGSGCAYFRPPAENRTDWALQQKPQISETDQKFYRLLQDLWLSGSSP